MKFDFCRGYRWYDSNLASTALAHGMNLPCVNSLAAGSGVMVWKMCFLGKFRVLNAISHGLNATANMNNETNHVCSISLWPSSNSYFQQ